MTPAERAAADEFFNNPMRGPEPYIEPLTPTLPVSRRRTMALYSEIRAGGPIPPFSNN